jgi:hypothetical protein
MRPFTIELLNYRCFAGPQPVRWTFHGDNLTSFVGPNNAGKSTLLRLIYEFRQTFDNLAVPSTLASWAASSNVGLPLLAIEDAGEFPSFGTSGPVIIDFSIDVTQTQELSRLRLTMNRDTLAWNIEMWHGPTRSKVTGLQNAVPLSMQLGAGRATLDTGAFSEWFRALHQKTMYIPAFRNLINQGGGTYYDVVVATDFIKLWDTWKYGGNVRNRRAILEVENDIRGIFSFEQFDVSPTPGKETFNIVVDGRTERVRELGAGISQFIMVLGNVAIKGPELLLIDEPELNTRRCNKSFWAHSQSTLSTLFLLRTRWDWRVRQSTFTASPEMKPPRGPR